MVKPVKTKEIRDLTTEELNGKLSELKRELFNLRFQAATRQIENPARIGEVKKSIARVKTVIREREIITQKTGVGGVR